MLWSQTEMVQILIQLLISGKSLHLSNSALLCKVGVTPAWLSQGGNETVHTASPATPGTQHVSSPLNQKADLSLQIQECSP